MLLDPLRLLAFVVSGTFAGFIGSLVGIGGGVLLVPLLVLVFKFEIHDAVASSLVAVVATSTASGSVYADSGLVNMRLGMSLEVATTIGGVAGGVLATSMSPRLLAGLFAGMVFVTAVLMLRGRDAGASRASAAPLKTSEPARRGWEERGRLAGGYFDALEGGVIEYRVRRFWLGSAVSLFAGAMSGMLGVGGGFLKVPAMTLGMKVPLRVAAATSNFMIGVTAVASLYVYYAHGFVRPFVAAPIALGVIAGSLVGTSVARRVKVRWLRILVATILVVVCVQMALKAGGIALGH